ncbi:hypothetical protein CQA53_01765 [Helicobacter didelphidarum]|uniref:Transglutaminase-like domain-containing protein n=1 Tax=Helicobacter didelphidarum TaxID=2040648 RepID=A0A3D8IQ33_9HELI|nr:hypothetical protein [Helicobacter didelphidarum]RDU67016.1 hypothetical protein CQA53_01765 [Helicobacter didelphidarum]
MENINAKRRTFLKQGCIGAGLLLSQPVFASITSKNLNVKKASLYLAHNVNFATQTELNLYIPIALKNEFQKPYNIKVNGNYKTYTLNDRRNIHFLQALWENKSHSNNNIEVSFDVDISPIKDVINIKESEISLESESNILIGESLYKVANNLSGKFHNQESLAKSLFIWVAHNLHTKEAQYVDGIRSLFSKDGDMLLRGQNLSASSVFVELCKLVGIPAIEAFGIIVDNDGYNFIANERQNYTRSVIKIGNKWIPNDIILAIEAKKSHKPKVIENAFKEWGNNWVLLNFARSVEVDSTYLSTFNIAYGEVNGIKLSSYNANHFSQKIFA